MNLYCETHAGLAKEDTLFIHGNLASTAWWQPTLAAWKKAGPQGSGRLFFADWRGCGRNEEWPATSQFGIEDLAKDFLELMDREGLKKVALVGHSLGGLIALQMMILAPERFSKAVLLDPVGAKGVVFDDSMYEAFRQMAANPELTRTVILSTIRHPEDLEDTLKDKLAADAFKAVRGIGTSVLEILKTVDIREEVGAIRTPTLILHGAHDAVLPIADSQDLVKRMKQARFESLPEAAHCWNVENPKDFTARVREWLA